MAGPRSQTEFDPSRTPFTNPAPRYTYMDHPEAGKLKIDSDSLMVVPIPGEQSYPGRPLRLPDKLMQVDQPHVHTCGRMKVDNRRTINKGCWCTEGGGCPIFIQYGPVGPVNLIVEKEGHVNSVRCYHQYTGITEQGRPTSQTHYALDGFNVLTDRTTIPERIYDPVTRATTVRQTEVPELAPFYRTNGSKKKPGRPKGSKNREKHAD